MSAFAGLHTVAWPTRVPLKATKVLCGDFGVRKGWIKMVASAGDTPTAYVRCSGWAVMDWRLPASLHHRWSVRVGGTPRTESHLSTLDA